MNLKKNWKGIYKEIYWDRALVLWKKKKKNLPGRGLTKVEKHWFSKSVDRQTQLLWQIHTKIWSENSDKG